MCLADLSRRAGRHEQALEFADSGIAEATKRSYGLNLAPLHRLRGEALTDIDVGAAEDAFHAAIDVAGEQGARLFGLQAALPLARLLQSNKQFLDADEVLAKAIQGLSPTPELAELAEAQALLDELRQSPIVAAARGQEQKLSKMRNDYRRAVAWGSDQWSDQAAAAFDTNQRDVSSPEISGAA